MATAEIAVALPALVLVTAIVLWAMAAVSTQLACNDAARTGARAAARGESLAAVRALVTEAVPEGSTGVDTATCTVRGDVVEVRVVVRVKGPGKIGDLQIVSRARAGPVGDMGVT
ncbi:TadE family type IV pilus minor pilin [Actinomadura sp. WAC 06369]|uniref:TadE family type IV pilus minor pilin n=1 Tax=Actinomadura sp. WAC 06369 TaxID=2203193 RepID=UPI000F7B61F6|nr:TadE family type IV pilus minor pilin [Actinomadura sp. WAC 06369]RSN70161.1 hypothetical protein DMH08_06720 [Actinomadura sp. WAC 06369]